MDDKTKRLDNGTGFGLSPSTKGYEMVTLVCIRREMVLQRKGWKQSILGIEAVQKTKGNIKNGGLQKGESRMAG